VVFFDYTSNPTQFQAAEPSAALKPDRVKPVLCDSGLSLYMDMPRFIAITGVEEEPIWP
jgi:hypothetical protein